MLGLGLGESGESGKSGKPGISEEIRKLMEEREKLRKEKKFAEADKIRGEIIKKGYVVEDTKI